MRFWASCWFPPCTATHSKLHGQLKNHG